MKRGLFVGINYTASPNAKLNGCINDVINMRGVLESKYGYLAENSVTLRDDIANPVLQPTRVNILSQLRALATASDACSEVWFHYSGHGGQALDRTGMESDGVNETILPCDFSTSGIIIDDEIFSIIKTIKCRAVLCFDSCHSGSVCDLEWQFEYTGGNMFRRTRANPANNMPNPNIVVISGCKDPQTSADAYNTTYARYAGAFSDAAYEVLLRNCTVALPVFYKTVCDLVTTRGFTQRPILSCTTMAPTYVFSPINPLGVATMSKTGHITVSANAISASKSVTAMAELIKANSKKHAAVPVLPPASNAPPIKYNANVNPHTIGVTEEIVTTETNNVLQPQLTPELVLIASQFLF